MCPAQKSNSRSEIGLQLTPFSQNLDMFLNKRNNYFKRISIKFKSNNEIKLFFNKIKENL